MHRHWHWNCHSFRFPLSAPCLPLATSHLPLPTSHLPLPTYHAASRCTILRGTLLARSGGGGGGGSKPTAYDSLLTPHSSLLPFGAPAQLGNAKGGPNGGTEESRKVLLMCKHSTTHASTHARTHARTHTTSISPASPQQQQQAADLTCSLYLYQGTQPKQPKQSKEPAQPTQPTQPTRKIGFGRIKNDKE